VAIAIASLSGRRRGHRSCALLSISPFLLEKALPECGSTNLVSVMRMGFHAFGTLSEITVLGIVGITVYALAPTSSIAACICRPAWRCWRPWCGCCCACS
jgi:multisubunit Na+/H+ antiporter MnhB subunit